MVRWQAAFHSCFVMCVAGSQKPMQLAEPLPPPPGAWGAFSLPGEPRAAPDPASRSRLRRSLAPGSVAATGYGLLLRRRLNGRGGRWHAWRQFLRGGRRSAARRVRRSRRSRRWICWRGITGCGWAGFVARGWVAVDGSEGNAAREPELERPEEGPDDPVAHGHRQRLRASMLRPKWAMSKWLRAWA